MAIILTIARCVEPSLRDYIINLVEKFITKTWKRSGQEEIYFKCPFHKGGNESKPSFYINVVTGVYFCHTCNIGGPILRLLVDIGIPRHIADAETANLKESIQHSKKILVGKKAAQWVEQDPYKATSVLSETVLNNYMYCPTKLVDKGFSINWLQHMEIGYDFQKNRIIYPIRDIHGNLAGVSGGSQYEWQEPKYKVYRGGYVDYTGKRIISDYGAWFDEQYPDYKMDKSRYIWNFDRVYARLLFSPFKSTMIIVEGFKACLWMLQNGYINTVALMGDFMSDIQYNLITRLDANILLFLDNNKPGRDACIKIKNKLKNLMNVTILNYPSNYTAEKPIEKLQPDDLTKTEIDSVINEQRRASN